MTKYTTVNVQIQQCTGYKLTADIDHRTIMMTVVISAVCLNT